MCVCVSIVRHRHWSERVFCSSIIASHSLGCVHTLIFQIKQKYTFICWFCLLLTIRKQKKKLFFPLTIRKVQHSHIPVHGRNLALRNNTHTHKYINKAKETLSKASLECKDSQLRAKNMKRIYRNCVLKAVRSKTPFPLSKRRAANRLMLPFAYCFVSSQARPWFF